MMPQLDEMLRLQQEEGVSWTPSKMIHHLGAAMNDDSCIATWAARNHIPVFSPALTDGSLGDMMYFHSVKSPGLKCDIIEDLRRLNNLAKWSVNTGMVIIG